MYETALAYTTAARMADNAILFKYLVKSVGMKHGILPSFMAKPWGNVRRISSPQGGVSVFLSACARYSFQDAAGTLFCNLKLIHLLWLPSDCYQKVMCTFLSNRKMDETSLQSLTPICKQDEPTLPMKIANGFPRKANGSLLAYWTV